MSKAEYDINAIPQNLCNIRGVGGGGGLQYPATQIAT